MISHLNVGAAHMAVHGGQAVTVIQNDGIAVKKVFAYGNNSTCSRCIDSAALATGNVQAAMRVAGLVVEETL